MLSNGSSYRLFSLFIVIFMVMSLSCQVFTGQPSQMPEGPALTATSAGPGFPNTPTAVVEVLPTQETVTTATLPPPEPLPTDTPVSQNEPSSGQDIQVSFRGVSFTVPAGMAGSVRSVFESGTLLSADLPPFGQYPNHLIFYLDGYSIAEHFHTARIEIYPADLLGRYSLAAFERLVEVKDVVSAAEPDQPEMPFLPLLYAAQVFHARSEVVDFDNGEGYRFLTVYSQGFGPVTNYDLFYAYQGLTTDGKYLIAAYIPVNAPILQADINSTEGPEGGVPFIDLAGSDPNAMPKYLNQVTLALGALQPVDFTPNLETIDGMLRTLRIDNIIGLSSACPALLQQNTRAYVSLDQPTPNRLRSGPSTSDQVIGELDPGTVVETSSGPVCANNLIFWQVNVPELDTSGWTAESDLKEQWLVPCPQEGACPPDWAR